MKTYNKIEFFLCLIQIKNNIEKSFYSEKLLRHSNNHKLGQSRGETAFLKLKKLLVGPPLLARDELLIRTPC